MAAVNTGCVRVLLLLSLLLVLPLRLLQFVEFTARLRQFMRAAHRQAIYTEKPTAATSRAMAART